MAYSMVEWIDIFGDNLKEFIADRGMSRKEVADEANLSVTTLSEYLNKRKAPSVRSIVNLAYALDCDVGELIDFGDTID